MGFRHDTNRLHNFFCHQTIKIIARMDLGIVINHLFLPGDDNLKFILGPGSTIVLQIGWLYGVFCTVKERIE